MTPILHGSDLETPLWNTCKLLVRIPSGWEMVACAPPSPIRDIVL